MKINAYKARELTNKIVEERNTFVKNVAVSYIERFIEPAIQRAAIKGEEYILFDKETLTHNHGALLDAIILALEMAGFEVTETKDTTRVCVKW